MLVLTRRSQEQIRIGDNITLTVVKVKGNTVRLGIEAPRDIRIVRGELPQHSHTSTVSASVGTSEGGHFCELSGDTVSDRQFSSSGDDVDEPTRLSDLVAKVRQASVIAHAV